MLVLSHSLLASSPRAGVSMSQHHKPRIQWLTALFALVWFASVASASALDPAPRPTPPIDLGETLLLDTRVPVFTKGAWTMLAEDGEHELAKRASTVTATVVSTVTPASSTSTSSTSTTEASPLPSPFDGGLSSNFTGDGSCPSFINWFLADATFKQCYPFSLLLQSSQSFFNAEKSLVSITQVLDASCAANVTFCTDFLNELATNLTDPSNCGADYQLGNSVVVQAYIGLLSYQTLYSATCLKDSDTSLYCFANAVTNLTTPSNVYIYYLPLNISLPGSSIPSCSSCLEQTMAIYQAATADRKEAIFNTYESAAQQINTLCGPSFVNGTLAAEAVQNSGFSSLAEGPPSLLLLSPLVVMALNWLL
ncbi:C6 zinc finger domain containing protein [Pleurostoma richardsiae]|uniref:C6 zinc finger domain containing protein n=1 Tax=Pleurostoma richardsiae TaxID=41990 RepID=A0AA38R737_9PEZI|nr:C6 zinc finger domain containing protein [Pleurostoma richardsiae]